MDKPSLKHIAARSTELMVAVLIALAFFLAFSGLLYLVFPSATTFSSLLRSAEQQFLSDTDAGGRSLRVTDGRSNHAGFQGADITAHLASIRNTVKSKSASEIAWSNAVAGMRLYDRHAIQTFDRSSAVIQFDEQNILNVGGNSVVVIRRLDRDPLFREKRSFLVVVDGELRGSLAASSESAVTLEVETPGAVTRIRTQDARKGKVDFQIAVDPNSKSSVITMLGGPAEIEAGGRSISVRENTSTVVSPEGVLSQPAPLPEPVSLQSPANDSVLFYRDLPPRISFTWAPADGEPDYLFTLGTDPLLEGKIMQERLRRPSFSHGNLKSGTYYWQVILRRAGTEERPSEIRRFTIVRDSVPPALTVDPLPPTIDAGRAAVTGTAEPGSRVYVMGEAVATDSGGRFSREIALRRGVNIVLVEAVDTAGNTTYRSQLVNAKF